MGFFTFASTKKVPEEERPPATPEQVRISFANARPSMRRDSHFSAGAGELETTANWHDRGVFVCCCGSARSFRTDSAATPRTASFSDYRMTNRPGTLPRAETWAAADEHRRINEPSYFASSDTLARFTQPPMAFDPMDSSTPAGEGRTPYFARKPSTMTMHAPQPQRRYTTDEPELPYKPNIGDTRQQPLERHHTIMSSYGVIEEAGDSDSDSNDEPTPRQASFRPSTAPPKVRSEREWINARQSMVEQGRDHAFDESRLDRMKDFLGAAGAVMSAFLD